MAPQKEVVLKLTSMRYKKANITEEQFHEHGSKFHGPKAALVQSRYGAVRVAQYHTPTTTRNLIEQKLPWAVRPGWKIDDHDCQISVYVRRTEDVAAIVMDPDFQALVVGDEEVSDSDRGTVTAGWEEVYVEDGKIVNIENGGSLYPPFSECIKAGSTSTRTEAAGIKF